MTFRLMDAQKANYPIAVMARVFGVSTSGYYDWKAKGGKLSARAAENNKLTETITRIHADSRGTYGSPRVHMELRLGQQTLISRKRVARLMRLAGLKGIYRRRAWGCTKRDPAATPNPDLVRRQFSVDGPDVLWVSDVTEHPTEEGKLYLATVIDAYSRRAIGWSIADHMRSELVVDALRWQSGGGGRRPAKPSVIRITALSTPRGRLVAAFVGPGCSGRWGPSAIVSTIPWPSRSSGPYRWSCSIARGGAPARSWRWQSSSTSRGSTTRSAGTLLSDISARWSLRPFTKWTKLPHDQLTQNCPAYRGNLTALLSAHCRANSRGHECDEECCADKEVWRLFENHGGNGRRN